MTDIVDFLVEHRLPFWTIMAGVLTNVSCAIIGCYLVLRRMSLLGDAISHGVLPGLVLAYLLTHELGSLPMFLGAMALGVLTTFLTQTLHTYGKVPEDASMGVVFTSLFALGVFMLSNLARNVHLDADCVLYGSLDLIPSKVVTGQGFEVPEPIGPLCMALVAVVLFVAVFWKELKIASFDPALATAMGISATLVHYLLMGMTAAVTVAAFESVGSVLVIAMLIVPAATAHLLTDRLGRMIGWAVLVAMLSSVLGYWLNSLVDSTVAGMMAVAAGAQFALAVVFAPRHGLLGKVINNGLLTARIVGEDVMALLYRSEELAGRAAKPTNLTWRQAGRAIGAPYAAWLAIPRLWRRGDVNLRRGGVVTLTDQGREEARSLVRSHRLWEAFLMQHFQLPLDHLHAPAERIEHFIGPQLQAELAAELAKPAIDPHGRAIPPATSP